MRGSEFFHFRGPSEELEVERLVQETFARAFTDAARARYDGVTPYGAYLCRVARNLMIDEASAARRIPRPTDEGELPDLASLEPSPEENVARAELEKLVADFLTGRPPEERKLYEARFMNDETQESAATRLGLARITVRRTEARLKEAFIRYLARRGALASMPQRRDP